MRRHKKLMGQAGNSSLLLVVFVSLVLTLTSTASHLGSVAGTAQIKIYQDDRRAGAALIFDVENMYRKVQAGAISVASLNLVQVLDGLNGSLFASISEVPWATNALYSEYQTKVAVTVDSANPGLFNFTALLSKNGDTNLQLTGKFASHDASAPVAEPNNRPLVRVRNSHPTTQLTGLTVGSNVGGNNIIDARKRMPDAALGVNPNEIGKIASSYSNLYVMGEFAAQSYVSLGLTPAMAALFVLLANEDRDHPDHPVDAMSVNMTGAVSVYGVPIGPTRAIGRPPVGRAANAAQIWRSQAAKRHNRIAAKRFRRVIDDGCTLDGANVVDLRNQTINGVNFEDDTVETIFLVDEGGAGVLSNLAIQGNPAAAANDVPSAKYFVVTENSSLTFTNVLMATLGAFSAAPGASIVGTSLTGKGAIGVDLIAEETAKVLFNVPNVDFYALDDEPGKTTPERIYKRAADVRCPDDTRNNGLDYLQIGQFKAI